jgi:hypothetical protein
MENNISENQLDQIIKCVDCNVGFILTPGERQFYLDRGLHLPKRCPECRARRRKGDKING